MKMNQLNKWKQELNQLTADKYKATDIQLFNIYRNALIGIKKRLKYYVDHAAENSLFNKNRVERLFNVAEEINTILIISHKEIEQAIKGYSASQAAQGYYGVWYCLEQSQNIMLNFPLIKS